MLALWILSALVSSAAGFHVSSSRSRAMTLEMLGGKLLIVQNKGGGHGSIGYQLCKNLKTENPSLEVVMLQDKCNRKKEPFNAYDELTALGVQIVEENVSNSFLFHTFYLILCVQLSDIKTSEALPKSVLEGKFDFIVDNWSKGPENSNVFIDVAKKAATKQYVFISSGGMYKAGNVMPIVETDAVKDTNGARTVELSLIASQVPYTFIRPQYIYGPKTSKRYLDFFIGRAARRLPIPVPLSGQQLVCLSHIDDVATLIAATIDHPAAKNEVFNCGSDEFISYQGLCSLIHTTVGVEEKDRKFLYYEPKDFDQWDGSGVMEFPFRRETFIVSSNKAKVQLGWKPKFSIAKEIKAEVDAYAALGGLKEEWTIEELKYDLEVMASKDHKVMFTYPFFDEKSINSEKRPYPFESASAVPPASIA